MTVKNLKIALGLIALLATGVGCSQPKTEQAKDAAKGACADGSTPLDITGLCQADALKKLPAITADWPAEAGCAWQVMESQLPDGVLLYRGLKCEKGETKLEFAGGSHRAELQLVSSAFSGVFKEEEYSTPIAFYAMNEGEDALKSVTSRAAFVNEDKKEAALCKARLANEQGWPKDAIVVDVPEAEAAKAPKNEPRAACGPLGYTQNETAYWRVFKNYAWYFNLGQDAFEIDPASLTIVTKDDKGKWGG